MAGHVERRGEGVRGSAGQGQREQEGSGYSSRPGHLGQVFSCSGKSTETLLSEVGLVLLKMFDTRKACALRLVCECVAQ